MRRAVLAWLVVLPIAAYADAPPAQVEIAIASWYGGRFDGRLTANGSRFDRRASTAAHRTLPFGTRLRVTDPRTGRSERIIITDRGPFVRGRDLDLSEGTATRLGLRERGVGPVLLERLR